jgi:glycosyltransferase involved in cell wall biosynthesis
MAVISLLHPSRQRPEKSLATCNKWLERAGNNVELIVSLDADDPTLNSYKAHPDASVIVNNNRSAVDAINRAAEIATGDIMIVVSDDTDCPHGWDEKVIAAASGLSDFVIRVDDGIQPWFITAPILDRVYYNRFGYLYHPEYKHMFVDTHFTHVAELLGRIIRRDDIKFPHLHYCKGHTKKDALNERADATWKQGEDLYLRHFRESFGIQGVDPWNIPDENHKNWLKAKLRR